MAFVKLAVVAPQGATLRGPARLKLSEAQIRRRAHLFGAPLRARTVDLDGRIAVTFKLGETIEVETDQKLPSNLFEAVEAVPAGPALVAAVKGGA